MPQVEGGNAAAEHPRGGAAAPVPIADYGVIGDTRSAALIARDGSLDWLCWPRFDSPPLFAALLDPGRGGRFALRPEEIRSTARRYRPGTNVLENEIETATGRALLTDAMLTMPREAVDNRLLPFGTLARTVECTDGEVTVELEFTPVLEYAQRPLPLQRRAGCLTGMLPRGFLVQLASDAPIELDDLGRARFVLRQGERRSFMLAINDGGPATFPPVDITARLIDESARQWEEWSERLEYDGPYRDEVLRSALVVKLMNFAPSGAFVAAPTTSLPERPGDSYNWDYRYCWLRDSALAVRALFGLGCRAEARSFVQWLLHTTRLTLPRLSVAYDVYGHRRLDERTLDHLSGYANSRPVRIGNAAAAQFQLDVYGEVMIAATISAEVDRRLDRDERKLLQGIAQYVMDHWREPDDGIWEFREHRAHHVHSKAMCWLALEHAHHLVRRGVLEIDEEQLKRTQREIAAEIEERGFDETVQAYTAVYDSRELDAALLHVQVLGYPAPAARAQGTVRAIDRKLATGELVHRHRNRETAGEGAFVACSFWMVETLARQGRVEEAHERFRKLLARANDVGLFSEEIAAGDGSFLGNFPLAFSHFALISAALTLQEVDRAADAQR